MMHTIDETRETLAREATFKVLLIDAICGVGFPTLLLGDACEKAGMAKFVGDQYNPAWKWKRNALARCDSEKLQELYAALCEARDEPAGVAHAG